MLNPTIPPDGLPDGPDDRSHVSDSSPRPPEQIGAYRILEMLGAGGMGEVYKAEQREPIRRTVALKIIKLGFDSREIIARFDSERQALSRMDHPHVARVLDAGMSETGRPFFVMEYVPGKPITHFADDNKLSITDRLELFTQACDAISHAHTKAVIHRDIKGANVLAYMSDGRATVKVIDFGIAKALTGDRLTDATYNTSSGQIVGTFDSMSPEQADGSPDIDTRTDVYSLGVLLYELLTGARPFDYAALATSGEKEMKRVIREVEPPRPSTKLSSLGEGAARLAERRRTAPAGLIKQLRAELEWIPLMAMRKERNRRYVSPMQLAEDIGNYLEGKPLIAGPESNAYKLRKFLARNSRAATAAVILLILSILGTSIYIHNIHSEQRQTHLAQVRSDMAMLIAEREGADAVSRTQAALHDMEKQQAISRFLQSMLETGKPTLLETLTNAGRQLEDGTLKQTPDAELIIRSTLASAFTSIGELSAAERELASARDLADRVYGRSSTQYIQCVDALIKMLEAEGKFSDAEALRAKSAPASQPAH